MESWFQRFVLTTAITFAMVTGTSSVHAAEDGHTILDDVISPDIQRRKISEDKIDSEIVEVGIYAGVLSIENFGSNDVFGASLALHFTEDLFMEAKVATSQLQETSYEQLSGDIILLTEEERDFSYYNLSMGYNLFPGELYFGKRAFYSNFYLIAGAGTSDFAGNEYFTFNYGAGFRLFASDWIALRVDFQNHVMTHDIFVYEKKIQNLEAIVGLTLFL